jgi:hypothetical protein
MARWAFLDTETGDWIEVKPGTITLAKSNQLRNAAIGVLKSWDLGDINNNFDYFTIALDNLRDALHPNECARCHHSHKELPWSEKDKEDGTCWDTSGPLICGCPKFISVLE